MTNDELIKFATRFDFTHGLRLEKRDRDTDSWAITNIAGGSCWSDKDSMWVYEPLPSNRTDELLAKIRYSLEDAVSISIRMNTQRLNLNINIDKERKTIS